MFAGAEIVDAVIWTGTVVAAGFLSTDSYFVCLAGLLICEQEFGKDRMTAYIFDLEILLGRVLLSEQTLPLFKLEFLWFIAF